MKRIEAPWTQEQVMTLNEYQHSGVFHPFTCPMQEDRRADHSDGEGILVARRAGWMCPDDGYTQEWAWDFMANGEWRKAQDERMELLLAGGAQIPSFSPHEASE